MDKLTKGRKAHVPMDVWKEIEQIRKEQGLQKQSEAFKIMASNSRVGRTAEKMAQGLIPKIFWKETKYEEPPKKKQKRQC